MNCAQNFTSVSPSRLVGVKRKKCSDKLNCRNIEKGTNTFHSKTSKSIEAIGRWAKKIDKAHRDFAIAKTAYAAAQVVLSSAAIGGAIACFFSFGIGCAISAAATAAAAAVSAADLL